MTLTIDFDANLEKQLRRRAAESGQDPATFVRTTMKRVLDQPVSEHGHLSERESDLLQRVNLDVPQEFWDRYEVLRQKQRDESLTDEERREVIAMSDRLERENVRRMAALVRLAQLRGRTLEQIMKDLGIPTRPAYE